MINTLLARYCADALLPMLGEDKPISRLAGLTKVLETESAGGKAVRYPIAVEGQESTCAVSGVSFTDLVPNAQDRLLVYFEDQSAVNTGGRWTSTMRLIAWGNTDYITGASPALLTATLFTHVQKLVTKAKAPYDSPVGSLRVEVVGAPPASTNLFSKYTYSETHSQYLLPPYFAFGIDLQLTYVLNDSCSVLLTGLPVPVGC